MAAFPVCSLLSFLRVVISKANEQYVMLLSEHVAKIVIIFLKQTFFEENNEKNREGNLKRLPNEGNGDGRGD